MPVLGSLHRRFAALIPELAKFGVVGAIGSVIDLGGADYLHFDMHIGPMFAKGISITAATIVTYLGSRFWTFRHRVNQHMLRETLIFAALNVIGLVIAEVVIAFVHYGMGMTGSLWYNGASLAGTGLGTIFRYFAYKKWVFLAADPGDAPAPVPAVSSGAGQAGAGGGRHVPRHAATRSPGDTRAGIPASPRAPAPMYGAPVHEGPGRGAPGYGTLGYGTLGYGTLGYGTLGYGNRDGYESAPYGSGRGNGNQYEQPSSPGQPPYYGPPLEHLDPAADLS